MNDMKVCSSPNCKLAGLEQPLDSFYINRAAVMGRTPRCKVCSALAAKTRYAATERRYVRPELKPARFGFVLKNLVNEQVKLLQDHKHIKEMHSAANWGDCQDYAGVYIEECERAILKIKRLLAML